jgi:hypothetical protein
VLEFKSRDGGPPPEPAEPPAPGQSASGQSAPGQPAPGQPVTGQPVTGQPAPGPSATGKVWVAGLDSPDIPYDPGVVRRPAGAVPHWAPVLDPKVQEEEPETTALWLARDLFLRGQIAEAQRSLRFAASWIAVSRQVWAIEEDLREGHRAYLSSIRSSSSNPRAPRPASQT